MKLFDVSIWEATKACFIISLVTTCVCTSIQKVATTRRRLDDDVVTVTVSSKKKNNSKKK